MKTLLIDNYDSYTFNLYHLIADIQQVEPVVIRNDDMDVNELQLLIEREDIRSIVISPGPGTPSDDSDFGIGLGVIAELDIPILGVCLGHQGIGHFFGTPVVHAPEVMHGRISRCMHNHHPLFANVPQAADIVRYHSLMLQQPVVPPLEVIATSEDDIVMAVAHTSKPIWGVQFHPESICTVYGRQMMENFFHLCQTYDDNQREREDVPLRQHSDGQPNDYRSAQQDIQQEKQHDMPLLASAQQPSPENNHYEVMVKEVDMMYAPAHVFALLYGETPYSFWLDSSAHGSFSYMGAYGGPHSQWVQYDVHSKQLIVNTPSGQVTREQSIYDYMEEEIQDKHFRLQQYPYDFNTGFVGFFGYDMKAEGEGEASYRANQPDAAFIFADRVIAFDHARNKMALLCLTKKNNDEQAQAWINHTLHRLQQLEREDVVDGNGVLNTKHPLLVHAKQEECAKHEAGQNAVQEDAEHEVQEDVEQDIVFTLDQSYAQYTKQIQDIKQYLQDGHSYEINLTNEISTDMTLDPLQLYLHLREINPAPYAAYIHCDTFQVLSSSPERFVKVHTDGKVEAKPIKGTIARSSDPALDELRKHTLQQSEKDRSENLMIVDLLRNDLNKVCEVGSVHVPKLMAVESFETVHQLVTTIRGQLKQGMSAMDVVKAAFPTGSMTGAPKIRSMQIIEKLEQRARGIYSGSIGYFGVNSSADFNVVIRTMIQDEQGITIGVGGAIVMLSDVDNEFDEMLLKAKALLQAITTCVHEGKESHPSYTLIGNRVHSEDHNE
ncbi:aminodeoxychorismate synthase [Longirhabdus pacifica]|uniref:aminodeoxychorismate synthase n=1 Tax=Longirhabdus pacifica TaxID=2305227 RepID=UPI001008E57F|nr:aminodeoxychorismate synthase [Longirhabdus pacifica]